MLTAKAIQIDNPKSYVMKRSNSPEPGSRQKAKSVTGKANSQRSKTNAHRGEKSDAEHEEGAVAEAIEQQTAKVPSDIFLWAAIGAMTVSLSLQCIGRKHTSLFIGQWAAPFLLFGIYNKLVKQLGHD